MATLVLQAAGNAILPGFGGVLGAAIGGVIDNTFLFPPPSAKAPRLDDLQFLRGVEGTPIPYVLGTARCPGFCFWKGRLIPHEEGGGKGGGGPSAISYSVDVAVGICEGPIESIVKIWANGTLLYDRDADVAITSDEISVTVFITYNYSSVLGIDVATVHMDLTSPSGGPDLSELKSGKNATLSGFANGGNNGTFRVESSSKNQNTGISTARLRNASATAETSGATVTIAQDLPEWSPNKASGFTFYLGDDTQTADPLMESYEGSGNVPGYRGRAYVVITRLQLRDFGNSMPQMQFLVEQTSGTKTIASAISDIMLRAGRPAEDFDVSEVEGDMRGYTIIGPQPVTQQLRPLLLAFDIITQEIGGVLHFLSRTNASEVVIEEELLAAHEAGSDAPRLLDVTDVENPSLPVEVNVTYIDERLDWQTSNQKYRIGFRSGTSDNVVSVDLSSLVLTPSEAQDVCRRTAWTAHANRRRVGWTLPPSKLVVQENDVLVTTAEGFDWRLLTTKIDRGANFLLEGDSLTEETDVLTFVDSPAADPTFTETKVYTSPEMALVVIDLAPLRAADAEVPLLYFATCILDSNVVFVGAGVYASDDDSTFELAKPVEVEATMGYTTNALSGTGVSVAYWDRGKSFNARFNNGAPVSYTEAEVLAGKGWYLVGREVVGVKDWALQGDGSYTATTLLRGLCNTEDMLTTHVAGEVCVSLDAFLIAHQVGYGDIGRDRYFKSVATGGILSQFESQQQRIGGNTLRHFSPCQVQGSRDASGNLTISWIRRTRVPFSPFAPLNPPLLDTSEVYEVEIWNDVESSVLRTLPTVTGATTTTYSAADQTTDFGSAHAAVHLRVYQVHSVVGRSKAASATV